VKPEDEAAFRDLLRDVPHECIGVVGGEQLVLNGRNGEPILSVSVADLEKAWRGFPSDKVTRWQGDKVTKMVTPSTHHLITSSPKVLILHANGTNRDNDAALACQLAGGEPEIVHINQLVAGDRILTDYHMLVIPGGFSYGDDLGAGVLWALDLKYKFGKALNAFVADGRPVLGICNGFQALVKSGLLPGSLLIPNPSTGSRQALQSRPVTLTFNRSNQFECRWVYLQPDPNSPSLFTKGLAEPIYCPVAHGEGRLAVQDEQAARALQSQNLIPLTYVDNSVISKQLSVNGEPMTDDRLPITDYPANPNGSILNIAALCNPAGNVMGLMPHPENHIFPWQHPRAQRGEKGMLGLRLFENGIRNA
jgi:phosphoribosylformylglycinamidine synthase I